MPPLPAGLQPTQAPPMNPSALAGLNPQELIQGAVINDIMNNGGKNVGSITQGLGALQPNQSAIGNRTAMQALSGYQQALANQGGTGGLGGFMKEAEAKGGGLLGSLGGGLGGAAAGAAGGAALGSVVPILGTAIGGLLGAGLGGLAGSKAGSSAGSYLSSKTGPGQFETQRQATAQQIAAGTGMDPATVLSMLPDYGENAQAAQTKLSTLQTMLSSGYAGSVQPASLGVPGQQSFGGVATSALPNMNAGNGLSSVLNTMKSAAGNAATAGTGQAAATVGTSLADFPEEALNTVSHL